MTAADGLPPRTPSELAKLDRLITLLGSRARGARFTQAVRDEFVELCGGVEPDRATAARWKQQLRQARKVLVTQPTDTEDTREDIAS